MGFRLQSFFQLYETDPLESNFGSNVPAGLADFTHASVMHYLNFHFIDTLMLI